MQKLNYDTMKSYQSFSTIEEMDHSVRGFLYTYKSSLSEGTLKVLTFIWRHSVKVFGVSFAKYDTIAAGVELNRRTVIRVVKTLENLGFLKKVPTARMNGKQGVNLLIIQPYQSIDDLLTNHMPPHDVTHDVTPNKTENKQSSLCENKPKKRTNVTETNHITPVEQQSDNSSNNDHEIDASFVPEIVHEKFIQAAKPFFHAFDIYRLWKRVLIAYNKLNFKRCIEDVMDIIVYAFKQTVFMKRMRKIHSSFEGYFYRTLYSMLNVEKRRENRHLLYDFIGSDNNCIE
ncbi:helix-turn-helix domain-containing protein [Metabacillus halosaccharovorans]|uniref:helix-turn-helix domain-containing protein n=1 Tax=Metabacillus halosaccharovorans TaxID=930124 RepID=UPI001C1F63BE|nr:helix-turn-helix domain-containing protein [Metabacillus halosaccharovorans]MBU7592457.1 helix-turn-helix domain-containing protein [Metabacillus halosaccharovorans]